MTKITPKQFAIMCYLVLMDHHADSYIEAHPDYLAEKMVMLDAGFNAYSFLDMPNQEKVRAWLEYWKYEMPEEIK